MNAIEVTKLGKTYPGGVEAVKSIDFEVAAGEVFGLLGPNGAGKSTTVGMLTTTIAPTAGSARLAGFDVAEEQLSARRMSSVVFQEPVIDRSLTGRRNLEIHARLWGVEPREAEARTDELAATLGLTELVDRPAGSLSGGECRRLEIARALVSQPRVLFLDEPTVGLDPRIRAELLEVIASLRNQSELTVLLTTHYLDEAERLCDRVAIIHAGRIVALDAPSTLRASLGRELIELHVDGDVDAALAALQLRGVAGDDAFSLGSRLTVPLHGHDSREAIVAVGTVGLLIPLNTMFSGLSVIVDRESGAQRELLTAPIPRSSLVLGNLVVALATTSLQLAVLIAVALARGIHFHTTAGGVLWFVGAAGLFAVGMYGVAEILAARVPKQEEYIARVPAIAIVPWFLAGALFPITALPTFLSWVAKFLPLSHALALMRYGLLQDSSGLHNIWGMSDPTTMAALSLGLVGGFAVLLSIAATRVFTRSATS